MRRIPVLALVTSGLLACENPTEPARLPESSEQVKVASPEAGTQAITLVSGNGPRLHRVSPHTGEWLGAEHGLSAATRSGPRRERPLHQP